MSMAAFVPLLPWPLSTFVGLAVTPLPAPDAKRYAAAPVLASPFAHLVIIVSAAWKVLFAAAVYYTSFAVSPADALALSPAWVARVAARDVAITLCVGCCWDALHLLPASPLYARLQPLKFSGVPARGAQVAHDAFWACVSALVASAWEVALVHAWARGWWAFAQPPGDAWFAHAPTVLALLALPHAQIVHFFAVHRVMHRWFPRRARGAGWLPDVGALLYQHVHYLHHRSRDPTAFSGISMHPVESALFFTTMPLAALAGCHPIVVLHAKLYNIVVAMIGHESYGDPSTGGHDHWLHHQLVDCNYGGNFVPLDALLGTFARDEDDFAARFGGGGAEGGEGRKAE
jgi:hypothetical protein